MSDELKPSFALAGIQRSFLVKTRTFLNLFFSSIFFHDVHLLSLNVLV